MFYITGISISVFLIILLLFKKEKSRADWLLLLWFIFISVHLGLYYAGISGITEAHPWLAGVILPLPLVHGPFLYLYVATLTGRLLLKKSLILLHFLPFLGCYLYLISFFRLPGQEKIFILHNQGVGFESFVVVNQFMIFLSGTTYILASILIIRKHKKSLLDQYSDLDKVNLKWLQLLSGGLGLIWIIVIVGNETQIFSSVVIYMVLVGFLGIKQRDIFTEGATHSTEPPKAPEKERPKYEKSGLNNEIRIDLEQQLQRLIDREKIYCTPDVSLHLLASRMEVHPNYLSQYINEELGLTFYDYINRHRVDEFKRIAVLNENRRYSMLALAYDCGFSSKSSFNRNFKKFTGQTPSQYLAAVR